MRSLCKKVPGAASRERRGSQVPSCCLASLMRHRHPLAGHGSLISREGQSTAAPWHCGHTQHMFKSLLDRDAAAMLGTVQLSKPRPSCYSHTNTRQPVCLSHVARSSTQLHTTMQSTRAAATTCNTVNHTHMLLFGRVGELQGFCIATICFDQERLFTRQSLPLVAATPIVD